MRRFYFLTAFIPLPLLAQTLSSFTLGTLIKDVTQTLRSLIPLLAGVAFIVFFWGLSRFILNAGNKTELENGRKWMLWGILALFMMFTFSAIINLLSGEFELGGSTKKTPLLPTDGTTESVDSTVNFGGVAPQ